MRKIWQRFEIRFFVILILFSLILFYPGFFTYFHQDDFIHFSYSETFGQMIRAFNILSKGEFPFYRPIPTEVYFYFGRLLFGFNPLGYHLINFFLFIINSILIYCLVSKITKNKLTGFLSTIIFTVNSTHFAPLYSPSYVHELLYVMFGLIMVYNFVLFKDSGKRKYYFFSLISFLLALMTKETAVILPGIVTLIYLFRSKAGKFSEYIKNITPFAVMLAVYLYCHFFYYGLAESQSYKVMIGWKTINILVWYFLWALSTPNILIDFVSHGLRINPMFFQIAGVNGWIYIIGFPIFLLILSYISVVYLFSKGKLSKDKNIFYMGIFWFVTGMLPLVIFPLHKLATEQAFSLVGLSLSLGIVVSYFFSVRKKAIVYAVMSLYLIIASNSIILGRRTHWIVLSAKQAWNVKQYFDRHKFTFDESDILYFRDGLVKIPEYGSSKQIYRSLGDGKGLKYLLGRNVKAYFEEVNPLQENVYGKEKIIEIDSSSLLGY